MQRDCRLAAGRPSAHPLNFHNGMRVISFHHTTIVDEHL